MSKPTVYLAGPVAELDDGGAGWRGDVEVEHGHLYDFRNPLSKYNVPVDGLTIVDGATHGGDNVVSVSEIVEGDKHLLTESDAVLVGYSAVRSIGTPMEVMWAYERDKPVAIWLRDGTACEDLSPWYRYHADLVTNSVKLALGSLDRRLGGDGDE